MTVLISSLAFSLAAYLLLDALMPAKRTTSRFLSLTYWRSAGNLQRVALVTVALSAWLISKSLIPLILLPLMVVDTLWRSHQAGVASDQIGKSAAAIADELADNLDAGLSFSSALNHAAGSVALPAVVRRRLSIAAQQVAAGMSAHIAFKKFVEESGRSELRMLGYAAGMHRSASSALAMVLREQARALEQIEKARSDAEASLSQVKAAAKAVIGLPVGCFALASLAFPGAVAKMFTSPLSAGLVISSLVLQMLAGKLILRFLREVS